MLHTNKGDAFPVLIILVDQQVEIKALICQKSHECLVY